MDRREWIKDKYCRVYVSQHYEGWEDRIFEHYNLREYLKVIDGLDSDVVIVTARTHTGYWFTDIGIGEMHPGLHGTDQLQETIEYFHKKDKLVIGYFSTVYDKKICELHPEWQEVDREGKPFHGGTSRVACMNSPYREYVLHMVETLFRKRDLDGILIDMPFYENQICYCSSCRRAYEMKYNRSIPEREDYSDEGFRLYMKARHRANTTFVQEMAARIREVNPDALIYPQCDLLKVGQRNSQDFEMAALGDYIYSDLYFEFGTIQTSVAAKFMAKLSKGLPEIGIMTRPGTHNDTPNMMPMDQLRAEVFTVLANGGAIHLFDIMWPDGTMQEDMWKRNARMFQEIRQRVPFLGGKSEAQVAVFHSQDNYLWYGKDDNEGRVISGLYGMCRAFLEAHIPFDIVPGTSQEELEQYDVLVLPNTACLSDEECGQIKAYVEKGGGLVCTNQTSMFDREGNARGEYGLAEVLGISYTGSDTSAYSRVYARFQKDHVMASGLPSDGMVTSWGISPKIRLKKAQVLADIVFPYTEPSGSRFINTLANPPAVDSSWPACTVNHYGRGTAIYFAGQPEKDFVTLSFPELKMLLANAVRAVMNAPEKVRVENSQPLEVTLFRNGKGKRVIHLVNQLFDYGRTMNNTGPWALGVDTEKESILSRNIVQKVYPLSRVHVEFYSEESVKHLRLEPSGLDLEFEQTGNIVSTVVPEIAYHEMIVIG